MCEAVVLVQHSAHCCSSSSNNLTFALVHFFVPLLYVHVTSFIQRCHFCYFSSLVSFNQLLYCIRLNFSILIVISRSFYLLAITILNNITNEQYSVSNFFPLDVHQNPQKCIKNILKQYCTLALFNNCYWKLIQTEFCLKVISRFIQYTQLKITLHTYKNRKSGAKKIMGLL